MIIRQTQTLIFEYPQDYTTEYEWCKTKDDRWVHKGQDTQCSIYETSTDFAFMSRYAQQTEPMIYPQVDGITPSVIQTEPIDTIEVGAELSPKEYYISVNGDDSFKVMRAEQTEPSTDCSLK